MSAESSSAPQSLCQWSHTWWISNCYGAVYLFSLTLLAHTALTGVIYLLFTLLRLVGWACTLYQPESNSTMTDKHPYIFVCRSLNCTWHDVVHVTPWYPFACEWCWCWGNTAWSEMSVSAWCWLSCDCHEVPCLVKHPWNSDLSVASLSGWPSPSLSDEGVEVESVPRKTRHILCREVMCKALARCSKSCTVLCRSTRRPVYIKKTKADTAERETGGERRTLRQLAGCPPSPINRRLAQGDTANTTSLWTCNSQCIYTQLNKNKRSLPKCVLPRLHCMCPSITVRCMLAENSFSASPDFTSNRRIADWKSRNNEGTGLLKIKWKGQQRAIYIQHELTATQASDQNPTD